MSHSETFRFLLSRVEAWFDENPGPISAEDLWIETGADVAPDVPLEYFTAQLDRWVADGWLTKGDDGYAERGGR